MGARSKRLRTYSEDYSENSRVPRWGHDQNEVRKTMLEEEPIAECPDGGTIKTLVGWV